MSAIAQNWPTIKIKRPERSIELALPIREEGPGIVQLRTGKRFVEYFITRIPSDFGTCYKLEKYATMGGQVYCVCLNGEASCCDCVGFSQFGYCKHISGCQQLHDEGKI